MLAIRDTVRSTAPLSGGCIEMRSRGRSVINAALQIAEYIISTENDADRASAAGSACEDAV